jgi:phosphoribosylformylglycinamidine (FGAM) synthase-like enzyme
MQSRWSDGEEDKSVTAPLSLIISAFAPVADVRKTVTPDIKACDGGSVLLLLDLGGGRNRLGASALTQVYRQIGARGPDLDDAAIFKTAFETLQSMLEQDLLLAYHDRSDGGLIVTLCEMALRCSPKSWESCCRWRRRIWSAWMTCCARPGWIASAIESASLRRRLSCVSGMPGRQ